MHACIGVFESFFWILHLSFVAFANTFTVTFVFANTFTIKMCGFSDQFASIRWFFDPAVISDQSSFGLRFGLAAITCKLQTGVEAPAGALVLY